MAVLEKFIPLLHLHNQSKLKLEQDEHFGDIKNKKIIKILLKLKAFIFLLFWNDLIYFLINFFVMVII
jgi:chromatin segregation and condensation protein Rec8/ScpA/Scc1 (kleisin family)